MKSSNFSIALKTLCVAGCFWVSTPVAHATDYVWSGDDSSQSADWFSPNNWEPETPALSTFSLAAKKTKRTSSIGANSLPSAGIPGAGDTATIRAGANVAINKALTVGALVVEKGASLQGLGNIVVTSSLELHGARLLGEGKVSLPAEATITLSGDEGVNTIAKSIENQGNLVWNSGRVSLQKDFRNRGTFYMACDAAMSPPSTLVGAAKPTFYNDGTLIKAVSAGQSRINASFVNTGDIYLRSGLLDVGPDFSQTDGSINLDGGDLVSAGTLEILGGVVKGIGTLNCNVLNDGGSFRPGHSPGLTTIMGNYTQTYNGSLDMEIGGTEAGVQYDQMDVWGTATLDGTLNIIKWQGYMPTVGSSFELISCYDLADDFATFTGMYPGGTSFYKITKAPSYYLAQIRADTTAPTISVTTPVANTNYNSIASTKGTANDTTGGSGVASLTVRLYRFGGGSIPAGYWAGGTTWTTGYTAVNNERPATGTTSWAMTLPSLPVGQYYVKITARDKVNNLASTGNIVFNRVASGGVTASATSSSDSTTLSRLFGQPVTVSPAS
jgi:hypothetical protein